MKYRIGLLLVGSLSFGACTSAPTHDDRNSILVLGSLHTKMVDHPHYTLREFMAALEHFKPDLILTEVRPDHPGPVEGSLDGGIEQSLVYAFATEKKVEVTPVDWFTDELIEASRAEDAKAGPELGREIGPLNGRYMEIFSEGTFWDIQNVDTEALVRKKYEIEEKYGHTADRARNERICKNINYALAKTSGKRVLVIFGLDHKYFLDDCVRRRGDRAMTAAESFNEYDLQEYHISPALRDLTLRNLEEAKALLKNRLTDGTYSGQERTHMREKFGDFDRWIRAVNQL